MEKDQMLDAEVPERDQEEEEQEEGGLDWLLGSDSEVIPLPMDTNVSMSRPPTSPYDALSETFSRERIFEAASHGAVADLTGLLDFLRARDKKLTSPEFTDDTNGKTALLKALLNLKEGKNDTIDFFINIAEETGDLNNLINSSYTDPYYRGQSALHVAIERRSFDHVQLLVQKGADVQAKANGKFFQRHAGLGFYFGELPLSLAACTNQPSIVSFLMDNPYQRADVTDRDSQGNTVLHTLVVIADSTGENVDMIVRMYDDILIQDHKLNNKRKVHLEALENNCGLTPLKLAAKLGKIGLFRHILHREFVDEETRPMSRKFSEWVYGPVHSSLYDMSSIDTDEEKSVLEIVVFDSEIPNRPEMLQIEPLRSLLLEKWDRFGSKLFLMNFLVYLLYLVIFTLVAFYRKEGQPPFPIEDAPHEYLRCIGEIISVFGALWFFYKSIRIFRRNPPKFKALYSDGFSDIVFFLQAVLLLICVVLYGCGRQEYVGFLVVSLSLAWINVLHYSRGHKQMGMYSVMMQRMILGDILHFLCFYSVFLFGFSAAIVVLIDDSPPQHTNDTQAHGETLGDSPAEYEKPTYNDVRFTTLEMFKFTIGMGDLQFTNHVESKEVFYILLILYIILTYILLLNMLIALMGNTVERISAESESIWNLQRAMTILDMERTLPKFLMKKLFPATSKMVCFRNDQDECQKFVRVEEMNWKKWRSDVGVTWEEDPGKDMMKPRTHRHRYRNLWNLHPVLDRIHRRHHQREPQGVP